MKVDLSECTSLCAYGTETHGFEFVYLESKVHNERITLFENRLASRGFWMNNREVARMVFLNHFALRKNQKQLINVGDEIVIESYKNRGAAPGVPYQYEPDGSLRWTPDCTRALKIIE